MLPKTINTQDFLNFCKEKGYIIHEKGTNIKIYTLKEVLQQYDEYETQKDIKKNLHKIVLEEIELYKKVTKMTESALADHIVDKLLSYEGLELINLYSKLKEE